MQSDTTKYQLIINNILQMIPNSEYTAVMSQEFCEYEYCGKNSFFGFLEVYDKALGIIPKGMTTIVDIGCYLAFQSYMFADFDRYIGVDYFFWDEVRFTPRNAIHINQPIQRCINNFEIGKERTFAICSYVPDDEAMNLVEKEFDNCYIYYPGDREIIKIRGEMIEEKRANDIWIET